jgi:hypothetical protein
MGGSNDSTFVLAPGEKWSRYASVPPVKKSARDVTLVCSNSGKFFHALVRLSGDVVWAGHGFKVRRDARCWAFNGQGFKGEVKPGVSSYYLERGGKAVLLFETAPGGFAGCMEKYEALEPSAIDGFFKKKIGDGFGYWWKLKKFVAGIV